LKYATRLGMKRAELSIADHTTVKSAGVVYEV
jgi:hypothetical protein